MPPVLPVRNVSTWVRNKVADLSATLLHLLEPGKGILKHASGIGDVTLRILPPVDGRSVKRSMQSWAATYDEVEKEFRELLGNEVEVLVKPKLGERRLTVI